MTKGDFLIMEELLWIGAAICLATGSILYAAKRFLDKDDPDYIMYYIKEYQSKNTCALIIQRNGRIVYSVNPNLVLPLASTMKYIIAIAYASQVESGDIDPEEQVTLSELERYYVKGTDGNAHPSWIEYEASKGSIHEHKIAMKHIAKGMMMFSSNANTDYLLDRLGIKNVNAVIKRFNLASHTPIFPITSALYIPGYIQVKQKMKSKRESLSFLQNMSFEEYREYALLVQQHMEQDNDFESNAVPLLLDKPFQKIWSDRLPSASASDYIQLMHILNQKNIFSNKAQIQLDFILESVMDNSKNQDWLHHAGQKGGSTLFVLTTAVYATDKKGNQTEVVFLGNNLDSVESIKLSKNMNAFLLKVLKGSSLTVEAEDI